MTVHSCLRVVTSGTGYHNTSLQDFPAFFWGRLALCSCEKCCCNQCLTPCNAFSWLPSHKSLKPVLLCFENLVDQACRKKKRGTNYYVYLNTERWKLTVFSFGDPLSQSDAKCLPASCNHLSTANAFTWDISEKGQISLNIYWQAVYIISGNEKFFKMRLSKGFDIIFPLDEHKYLVNARCPSLPIAYCVG